ncbi:hypothetical protein Tco_1457195 [Tanacetum coccineum]
MQAEEQEQLSIEEKSKLFLQLLEARKKHFTAMRTQEKRNKPPTKAQRRNIMSTYLKNIARYKHAQLKNKSFKDIQIETREKGSETRAEGIKTKAEASSKRSGEDLQKESTKKQKVEDDKEKEDLKQCFKIVPEEEVAINVIPLATKPAPIVDFQIHRVGRQGYYEIIRADGSSKTYLLFSQLLKEFD